MARSISLPRPATVTRMAAFALFFFTLATATLGIGTKMAQAAQASLSWSSPTTYSDGTPLTSLKGYKIYTGTAAGSYAPGVDVGNANSYTATGLSDGTTYYFAVTAYDSTGNSSGYSNQVSYTTPSTTSTTPQSSIYTVTASAGAGGTISPSGSTVLNSGGNQSYTVTPNTGYYVSSVNVDGTAVASNIAGGAAYTYTFSNVTASHTISATFAVRAYRLVSTAGTGGSVTPADAWVQYQGSQTITISPSSGYRVSDVKVDGTSVGGVTSYTFSKLSADHTLSATFSSSPTTYSITASAGTGGSITPAGATSVNAAGSQSYTVTPNTGYYVVGVVVDGTTVVSNIAGGAGYSYTFSNVTAAHTISATFAIRAYHLVSSPGTGGSVTPADSWVQYQGTQTIAITPASGYQVADVKVDGTSVGAVGSYTFNKLSADHTLSATFTQGYTITASAGANGSISPTGTTSVAAGTSKTYTVTPATGYYVVSVVVDGKTVVSNIPQGGYSYTFSNLAGNHTISATFAIRYYNITATAGSGGSITPGNTWVLYNTSQTVTITPAAGKKIAGVTVDGASVGAVSSYTFNNVSAGHTVQATFL